VNIATEAATVIEARLRDVPDFPQPGIVFKDIVPLLADGTAFETVICALTDVAGQHAPVDLVAGIEARGFILAAALAARLGCGLVPVRKAGKLPPPTIGQEYVLEYGAATVEVPEGVLTNRRVFLVDDVLATGGTLAASADLIDRAGGQLVGMAVLLELGFLNGRNRLPHPGVRALLTV
jgi:adenine phosphoribosyltransferase